MTPLQAQRYAHLETELLTAFPKQRSLFLPTRIGNLLRAAEEYPQYWYGLEIVVTWPRLWLLLPDATQQEIAAARQSMDNATVWLIWAILFSAWWPLNWLAIGVSLLAAFIFLRRLYAVARVYSDQLSASYDLNRLALYRSIGWQLPKDPCDERALGEQITQFFRRRQSPPGFTYQLKDEK